MRFPDPKRVLSKEAGFSMVEMLMAAFILSIGILGITLLQVMSLKASRGSQSLTTAVQVAEQVMDSVELEGRLTLLNITSSEFTGEVVPGLRYIVGVAVPNQSFNIEGGTPIPASPDPKKRDPFFTVGVARGADVAGTAGVASDFQVTVSWADATDNTNTPIPRQVVLARRIVHG